MIACEAPCEMADEACPDASRTSARPRRVASLRSMGRTITVNLATRSSFNTNPRLGTAGAADGFTSTTRTSSHPKTTACNANACRIACCAADTRHARLSSQARVAARAAINRIGLRVNARAIATSLACRAAALTGDTRLTKPARLATRAAIIRVGLHVDAGPTAVRLAGRTAYSIAAGLVGSTARGRGSGRKRLAWV